VSVLAPQHRFLWSVALVALSRMRSKRQGTLQKRQVKVSYPVFSTFDVIRINFYATKNMKFDEEFVCLRVLRGYFLSR
jgi:hypothetical protein